MAVQRGRPRGADTLGRIDVFWQVLRETGSLAAASKRSKLAPATVLNELDKPGHLTIAAAIQDGHTKLAAVAA